MFDWQFIKSGFRRRSHIKLKPPKDGFFDPTEKHSSTNKQIWPKGLINSLHSTINEHLPIHKQSGEALVIGVYGEWGSGKSALLNRLYQNMEEKADNQLNRSNFRKIIIPVSFNPWRFER
jgi:predicted ATPase